MIVSKTVSEFVSECEVTPWTQVDFIVRLLCPESNGAIATRAVVHYLNPTAAAVVLVKRISNNRLDAPTESLE